MNNKEKTQECINIMQAAIKGGTIRCAKRNKFNQGTTQWVTMDHCPRYWNWNNFRYEIVEESENEHS